MKAIHRLASVALATIALAPCNVARAQTEAQVGAGDASVVEGNAGTSNLDFPVLRSGDATSNLVVPFSVSPGTATAGTDYLVPPAGSIVRIPAGMTQGTARVAVVGDTATEANETLTLQLGAPVAFNPTGGFRPRRYFGTPRTTAIVGMYPSAVISGDFTGDGKPDLVAANANSGDIGLLPNDGTGGFLGTTSYPTGDDPVALAKGRFNADAFLDSAVVNQGAATVTILLADGHFGFVPGVSFATGALPSAVGAGDFNGDGKVDLVVANSNDRNVSVRLGDGLGGFGTATNFPVGNNPASIAVADLNGDGKLDLAVANFNDSTVSLLVGNGAGSFGTATNLLVGQGGANPLSIVAADFDADGAPDLAVVDRGRENLYVYFNDGAGGFAPSRSDATYTNGIPLWVTAGDFTDDGVPDLAVALQDTQQVLLLINNGAGSFMVPFPSAAGGEALAAAVDDFDGDGKPDLAVTTGLLTSGTALRIFPGLGPPPGIGNLPSYGATNGIVIGDFNRDGKGDLAVGTAGSRILVFLGDGAGGFSSAVPLTAIGTNEVVVTTDFNGDGNPDLASFSPQSGNAAILLGDGHGAFSLATYFAMGASLVDLAVGDFNGDGKPDIVTANGGGTVTVRLGTGSGGLGAASSFAAGASPLAIAVGEFNGDGKADLVVGRFGGRSTSLLLGNGDGTFADPLLFEGNGGGGGFDVAVTDFNHDGRQDVVTMSDNAYLVLGNGDGTFKPIVRIPHAGRTLAIGDLNGDGNPDIAGGSYLAAPVALVFGDGSQGATGSLVSLDAGLMVKRIAIGDLNGDGRPDVATANENGRDVTILFSPPTPTAVLSDGTAGGTIYDDEDITPNGFAFTAATNVQLNTPATSNTVTIAGLSSVAPISVTGGTYSIGCSGVFTASSGSIGNGQSVCVRQTGSASPATSTTATLTVGTFAAGYTVTTRPADTAPDAFTFVDQANVPRSSVRTSNAVTITGIEAPAPISVLGGTYSIGCTSTFTATAGTIGNGQTVCVRHTASGSFSTAVNTTLTVGGVPDTFTSTTAAADTTPDPFTFVDRTGAEPNTFYTSNAVTIAGIDAPAPIAISGADSTYSIGCTSTFTAAAGTIGNGQTVCVKRGSGPFSTTRNAMLTVGGVSDLFSVTVRAADTTPDAFHFVAQADVPLDSLRISNTVAVAGIEASVPISVVNGSYSIGCTATFTKVAATIGVGQTVCVRHQAASQFKTPRTTTLTIGGVSGTFITTTVAGDTTPDPFSFVDQQDVPRNSVRSASVAISGITAAAPISIVGGTYSIGCAAGSYTFAAGKVPPGATVCVRHTASSQFGTSVNTSLTVGGVFDTFTSTTVNDTTPDAFAFVDQPNVPRNAVRVSNAVTIGGIGAPAKIAVTGGTYSIGCTAAFTGAAGTIANGQSVCVRQTSAATFSTTKNTMLTVGGVSDTFTSTTVVDPGQ